MWKAQELFSEIGQDRTRVRPTIGCLHEAMMMYELLLNATVFSNHCLISRERNNYTK